MMFRRFLCIILLIAVLWHVGLIPTRAQSLAEWTVLIYLDGDNDLEREAVDDFLEMATVGSSSAVNILVQFDRIPGYDTRYGDWSGTLRFRVEKGMTPEPQYALFDLDEVNMGDPKTLLDFVQWGLTAFPARRVALILWNHGDGWRAASPVKSGRKAVCWDDTSGRDALDVLELRDVLAVLTDNGAQPLELLAFDACLMAMIEVDAQIASYALVRVGSEDTEPGTGYPYHTILRDLVQHPDRNGIALGTMIVERYYQAYGGETQSAVRLGEQYLPLLDATDRFALTLIEYLATEQETIYAARRQAHSFEADYVDLADLARLVGQSTTASALRSAAQGVIEAVTRVTLANRAGASHPGANGVSIYFPAQPAHWDTLYAGDSGYLVFTAQTHWDEFLQAYLEALSSCDPDPYEPDDSWESVLPLPVDGRPQRRNFCPATDLADWVAFEVPAGWRVQAFTADLASECDTVLSLYAADGTTLLAQDDDGGMGRASNLTWYSPATTTLYLRVNEYYRRIGRDTDYTLTIRFTGPEVTVSGRVALQGRTGHNGVQIQAQPGGFRSTSGLDGAFELQVTIPCTITASFDRYLPARWVITQTVTTAITTTLTLDPATLWAGDLNGDGRIDILDIAFVGARFGSTDPLADLTADGIVDIRDLVLPAGNFGRRVEW